MCGVGVADPCLCGPVSLCTRFFADPFLCRPVSLLAGPILCCAATSCRTLQTHHSACSNRRGGIGLPGVKIPWYLGDPLQGAGNTLLLVVPAIWIPGYLMEELQGAGKIPGSHRPQPGGTSNSSNSAQISEGIRSGMYILHGMCRLFRYPGIPSLGLQGAKNPGQIPWYL